MGLWVLRERRICGDDLPSFFASYFPCDTLPCTTVLLCASDKPIVLNAVKADVNPERAPSLTQNQS